MSMKAANRTTIHQCEGHPVTGHCSKQQRSPHIHDKKTLQVKFTDLATWIQGAYHMGGGFHQLLSSTLAQRPVLHVLLHADEVTPGHVLAPVASRKTWAICGSFKVFHRAFAIHQQVDHPLRHKKFPHEQHEQCGSQREPTHESAGAPNHQHRTNRHPAGGSQRHATTNAIQALVCEAWLLDHGWCST